LTPAAASTTTGNYSTKRGTTTLSTGLSISTIASGPGSRCTTYTYHNRTSSANTTCDNPTRYGTTSTTGTPRTPITGIGYRTSSATASATSTNGNNF
jgi:hypothetical protein